MEIKDCTLLALRTASAVEKLFDGAMGKAKSDYPESPERERPQKSVSVVRSSNIWSGV